MPGPLTRTKRVVVDRFGGPEVLSVVEEESPRPGPGEVRVRVLAADVSFTDAQLRAGTYIPGGPKLPFTPGYELVGTVEELGPGCSRLRVGDRIGALTVWGAYAERVCVPGSGAVEVPEDLDPAEVVSLVFPLRYLTRPVRGPWTATRGAVNIKRLWRMVRGVLRARREGGLRSQSSASALSA